MLLLIGVLCVVLLTIMFFIVPLSWLVAAISVAALAMTSLIFGFERPRWREKNTILINIIVICLVWLIVQFLSAFVFALAKQNHPSNYLLLRFLPAIVTLISSEMIRSNLICKSGRNKIIILISTLFVTLIGGLFLMSEWSFLNNLRFTQFLFINLIPWLFSSAFLSFLVYKTGWQPAVAYRALTELPIMLLPIYTDFGNFAFSVVKLIFPIICYILIYRITLERQKPVAYKYHSKLLRITGLSITVILTVALIMLFSGLFKYYPLAIASGSMSPSIKIGDLVIVEKLSSPQIITLKAGDTIVFSKSDRKVLHRIVSVSVDHLHGTTFITKGDANNAPDPWVVEESEVIGTSNFKLSFIGYPTLWVNQQLGRE